MRLVSVIVPVYNAEKYLGYCISSILRQTYRNIEVILVNDGSTDGSLKICNNYLELDSRIKIIDIPNGGVGHARNVGIEAAKGDCIIFVDSDDVIAPDMVGTLYYSNRLYGKNLVICGIGIVGFEGTYGKCVERYTFDAFGKEVVFCRELFLEKLPELNFKSWLMANCCNRIYQMDIIRNRKIRFPLYTEYGEDFLFNLEYYRNCNGVVLHNECLYYHTICNEKSLSQKYKEDLFENQMQLMKKLQCLLIEETVWDRCDQGSFYSCVVSYILQGIRELFHADSHLNEDQIKKALAVVCLDQLVRESIPKASYVPPDEKEIVEKIMACDVGGIYADCQKLYVEKVDLDRADDALELQEEPHVAEQKQTGAQLVYTAMLHIVCFPLEVVRKITGSARTGRLLDAAYQVGLKEAFKEMSRK